MNTVNSQINRKFDAFYEIWDEKTVIAFMESLEKILELFPTKTGDYPLRRKIGDEHLEHVRAAALVHQMSLLFENFGGKINATRMKFPNLALNMENLIRSIQNGQADPKNREGNEGP